MEQRHHRKLIVALAVGIPALVLVTAALLLIFCNRWRVRIQLEGEENVTLSCGEVYTEQGAEAVFGGLLFPEFMQLEVTQTGEVDTAHAGVYTVTYEAHYGRFSAEKTRTVRVEDHEPPVIELQSIPGAYTLPGAPYEEEGYTAHDNSDGDLTDRVQVTEADGVVTYTVQDSSGNAAIVTREIVYDDPIAPVLTLLGETELELRYGEDYEEPGYVAQDNVDGDLTSRVSVTGEIDSRTPGSYELTYTVEDAWGNRTSAIRTVVVPQLRQADDVHPDGKIIYLTFDDGPSKYTETLLEILARYNVKVTFFVVNYGYTSVIGKEAAAGHSVGIHSATHDYNQIYASEEAYYADLNKMRAIIHDQTGVYTTLLRFPGGSSNRVSDFNPGIMTRLVQSVTSNGYTYFDWNVSSGDAGLTTDTDVVYQNVIDGVSSHDVSIVLMHDSKGYSVDAVERIIVWGLQNGYTFLPLTPGSPTAHHHINN